MIWTSDEGPRKNECPKPGMIHTGTVHTVHTVHTGDKTTKHINPQHIVSLHPNISRNLPIHSAERWKMSTISSTSLKRRRARTCKLLTSELHYRSIYQTQSNHFYNKLSTHLTLKSLQFNLYPQIVSPHQSRITSLEIDNSSEGRFLLSGSQDCTISVYDLSLLGSEYHLNRDDSFVNGNNHGSGSEGSLAQWRRKNRFRPIARSQRNFFTAEQHQHQHLDPLHVPCGHSHSITQVKWYPVDSGIFISSDSVGNILMWDTNTFTPVACLKKSGSGSGSGGMIHGSGSGTRMGIGRYGSHMDAASVVSPGISSMDLPKSPNCSHSLLAIGSIQSGRSSQSNLTSRLHVDDRVVYLCDVKSGNMTHQLSGHGVGGIQVVQWSPIHEYILASGSRDGTIKLWDIRKSGSAACLITLDRENRTTNEVYFDSIQPPSRNDANDANAIATTTRTRLKKKRKRSTIVGPGDYSKVECSNYIQSHAGPIANLSFTPDGNYLVSVSSVDGLKLWDLQSGKGFGTLLPTRYTHPSPPDRTRGTIPLRITQPGNFKSATAWIGGSNMKVCGFSIHGDGGRANKVLAGHLDEVTAIASQDNAMRLFSGSRDGMILGFGNRNEFEPDDD